MKMKMKALRLATTLDSLNFMGHGMDRIQKLTKRVTVKMVNAYGWNRNVSDDLFKEVTVKLFLDPSDGKYTIHCPEWHYKAHSFSPAKDVHHLIDDVVRYNRETLFGP